MKAILIAVLFAPTFAYADQCETFDDAVATRAMGALRGHPKIVEFCEPCGDKAPGEPHALEHLAKQRDRELAYSLTLDKREVDLAYVYVQTAPSQYENVAQLAGCATSGVSPSLIVHDASDTGVMIVPSDTPVAHVQLAPDEPETGTPTTIVIRESSPNYALILVACLGSGALWAFATMLLLRRRRISMRPRAIEIVQRSDDAS